MTEVYSIGEVARLLGVPPHRIAYSHSVGKSPEPMRVFGKRAYRWNEIVELGRQLGVEVGNRKKRLLVPAAERRDCER